MHVSAVQGFGRPEALHACWVVLVQGIQGVSYNQAGGYYSITGGCNSLSSLPDIAFTIDGHAYYMPPVQWTQAVRPRRLIWQQHQCS